MGLDVNDNKLMKELLGGLGTTDWSLYFITVLYVLCPSSMGPSPSLNY